MYKLVYTSNPKMEHHLQENFDLYVGDALLAVGKDEKGFSTSRVIDSAIVEKSGIMVKTNNSTYIFAYINEERVSEFSGYGFIMPRE